MRDMDPEKMRHMEAAGRHIGRMLEGACREFYSESGERWGFALLLFSFSGPELTWISNANRADMVKALQEFISRNPPDITSEQRS